jgi:sulfite dehydrogenase
VKPEVVTMNRGRRKLLLTGAAFAGSVLASGASRSSEISLGRVVVVGGGFGGATAARYLRLWAGNIHVTLIERNPSFTSCPMSNLVLGAYRQMRDITRSYDSLQALGVRIVQGEVIAIDAAGRSVRLADGSTVPYDRLIISPGIDFMSEQVPGLSPALVSGQVVHAWHAGVQTMALRRQLEAMPDGGVFAITIPKVPYRCPPGPYERACLVASYFRQAKPKSKVLVLDANPEIQSKKALFERAFAQYHAGILEYRPNAELKEVDGHLARLEFEDVKADVLNVVPPQRAGDLARKAGLVNVNQRWVGVNWLTMESTVAPGIHVLGDATFSAPLMPKSAHMANQHAKLAAAAVIQLLKGEPVNASPVVMNTCYSFITPQDAIHVASVHQYDASERTYKTVPGAGGVSAAANPMEARYALAWAENIWADTLG